MATTFYLFYYIFQDPPDCLWLAATWTEPVPWLPADACPASCSLNTTACAVNQRLDEHLHGHPRAHYLPRPDWATETGNERDLLSRERLHLSPLGVETLAAEVTTAVAEVKQVCHRRKFQCLFLLCCSQCTICSVHLFSYFYACKYCVQHVKV